MKAEQSLAVAARLVAGPRQKRHGDRRDNHRNIACLWTGWLKARGLVVRDLTPHDAAMMMGLLKDARTLAGGFNPDDYVDGAAYRAIAGEIRETAEHESAAARKGFRISQAARRRKRKP